MRALTNIAVLLPAAAQDPSTPMMAMEPVPDGAISPDEAWTAVVARDARYDGRFVYAVATTGIYCRPVCSARRPLRANAVFFPSGRDAESAGFRACRRCRPERV
jgi:methylphosphotriester-DNA--protein-cysteine methyltransferase